MNSVLSAPTEFAKLLQGFFSERLLQQQNVSPKTIVAYRDTFRLLLNYAQRVKAIAPEKMALCDFSASLILDFLTHLETERHNMVRSRNLRLAGVRAFAHYVTLKCPASLQVMQQILAIPMKRFEKPLLGFLSREEIKALLNAPDTTTWCGYRDRIMFELLYNTGARVSELLDIKVADVTLAATSSVRLHGKGRKQRTVPLWKETAVSVRQWLKFSGLRPDQQLVPNRSGAPMTRTNVAERLALAIAVATKQCPQLKGRKISPHSLRHTTAMYLLQSGVDITVIALWLGHENPATTHGYMEAYLAMKERALAAISPPEIKRKRYQPNDTLLRFLESL